MRSHPQAAEEQESRAVRAGEKRVQQWQELVNRTAVASASGKGGFHEPGDPANQVRFVDWLFHSTELITSPILNEV